MSMSAVRRALKEGPSPPQREAALGLVARSRASGITIPQLARRTRLKSDILFKLDRGVLQLETVPKRLLAQLAEALVCPVDALTASLPTSPMTVTAMYYADQAPDVARQQSFAEALAQSDELPEDDRLHWLAVVREEGLSM